MKLQRAFGLNLSGQVCLVLVMLGFLPKPRQYKNQAEVFRSKYLNENH
jgi:hypothetical protein